MVKVPKEYFAVQERRHLGGNNLRKLFIAIYSAANTDLFRLF
jgi:hypothetical protein